MKFRRRGVKREHSVLDAFADLYERLAGLAGVTGVIPGRIAHNPTRHPGLVLKHETPTGYKLLAKTNTSVQEVFVVVRSGCQAQVRAALADFVLARPAGDPGQPRRPPTPPRPPRAPKRPPIWRNPGVLPEGPRGRPPVHFESAGPRAKPRPGSPKDPALRRRLWLLRLRRARWRRRFGVPRRQVPLARRRRT